MWLQVRFAGFHWALGFGSHIWDLGNEEEDDGGLVGCLICIVSLYASLDEFLCIRSVNIEIKSGQSCGWIVMSFTDEEKQKNWFKLEDKCI